MESQPLEGVTGARRVIVPWTEANDVWLEWRRRVPETGLWPVVLGSPDEARELLDAMADQRGAGAPGPETADSPDSPPSFEAQIEALGQRWKHELATAEATLDSPDAEHRVKITSFPEADMKKLAELSQTEIDNWITTTTEAGYPAQELYDKFLALTAKYQAELDAKGYPWERD